MIGSVGWSRFHALHSAILAAHNDAFVLLGYVAATPQAGERAIVSEALQSAMTALESAAQELHHAEAECSESL